MHQQRVLDLKKTLNDKNIDAFLVSNFFNILYLSGFKTLTENEREVWMLITNKNAYLFSDARYISENPKSEARNSKQIQNFKYKLITPEKGLLKHLEEIFREEGIRACGIESEDIKINEFQQLSKILEATKLLPTEKLIIKQREIKTEEEINKIKGACEMSDRCLTEILKNIRIGQTEKEIAFKIEFWLKEKGYDLAFYPIVAIDENSAVIHYDTRNGNNKKVGENSIILIDFGAKYQDYLSDITRMIFFGKPTDEIVKTYNQLLSAQQKTVKQCNKETMVKNIDHYCRQQLTSHLSLVTNYHSYPHSTGHGVGLEIHEYPKISPVSDEKLHVNQVITIEPGIYFEEKWGMRIEDTVLVKNNNAESLTKFPKKLLIL